MISSPIAAIAKPIPSNDNENEMIVDDVELQQILQSSLSVIELDKEIDRIQSRLAALREQLLDTEFSLYENELQIQQKQKAAGNVLVAYYKGERNGIYLSLLKTENVEQFLHALELIEFILKQDRQVLSEYINEYKSLRSLYEQFSAEQEQLLAMEQELKQQRLRVLELEAQIDAQLTGRSDAQRVELLIKELTQMWEEKGVLQVRTYFEKLAHAMNELPAWLQKNKQYMSSKGFTYTISLPDDALNQYLREYDDMFQHFEFQFHEDSITARGEKDDLEIEISGHYSIVEEPSNYIAFTIDQLTFNGFTLPDSTKQELMQQFDLNFYPSLIVKFLRAKEVTLTSEALTIELKLSL